MNAPLTADNIWSVLATIPDPEFGLNIVDMGLIYDVRLDGANVAVAMTLTSPGCPAGEMIFEGVKAALAALSGVGEVHVDLVWEPAWTPDRLTAAARDFLGWKPEASDA